MTTTLKFKLYLLFVFFYAAEVAAASSATSPQGAQESCYGQYLREHNMAILTAEDADDNYGEQKKAVLAKQMYGDSYQLMVDTIAQRAVITKADGTYIADIHATLVDSTWYMWLSVDPLADKYPNNSPYMYCSGNPLKYVDPDGREKKILVTSGAHLETAEDEPNPLTALVIFAHGSSRGIIDEVYTGETNWTGNATIVANRISEQSETFKNDDIKDKLVILSCCNTGAKPIGKDKMNFAQLLSLKLYNELVDNTETGQNVYVCAPTASVIAGSRKLFGLIRARAKGTEGNMPWVIYNKGKEIDRFWTKGQNPTEKMIRQRIQKYENEHKTSAPKD